MEINRTGPRQTQIEDPAAKPQPSASRFRCAGSPAVDAGATAPPTGVPPGITPADLRDAGKAEAALMSCFNDMVDNAGQQLGVTVSDEQRQKLLEFLGSDPMIRGKLLSFLEQVVK
jgi:hypothetical protein